ncbi:hypothetical protein BY996DRAFT_1418933 [Phakopsora pachyrhizi]|nr:hypothetical protein BY996DRAFT_1418933 [Phakopsora pachyrhizi]
MLNQNWPRDSSLSRTTNQVQNIEFDKDPLRMILSMDHRKILTLDPFRNAIGIDFGFGCLHSLNFYGIDSDRLSLEDALRIDDLYLFEKALRNDELLTDKERFKR